MMSSYFLPPEWSLQKNVWLSWPHNRDTWYNKTLFKAEIEYSLFVGELCTVVDVHICVLDFLHECHVIAFLKDRFIDLNRIEFHQITTNDAWMRDHGPDFIFDSIANSKVILNWGYNAWGGKYPPFYDDNLVPLQIAKSLAIKSISIDMILEGGSFEVNGEGDLLTTKSCLLNENRNPHLSQQEIEECIKLYFGVNKIHWLDGGIEGDDTDGHIDDFARFVANDTIIYNWTDDRNHQDYKSLKLVEDQLKEIVLNNGHKPVLVKIPVADVMIYEGEFLPCSYANFLITNKKVLVPIFGGAADKEALEVIQEIFLDRKVIGIPSNNIIIGLGSLHCLSKHEFDESQFVKK